MIFGQISWLVLLNKIICSIAKAVYAGVDERKFQRMEFYVYLMVNHQGSCFRPNITLSLSLSHSLALSLSRSLALSHSISLSHTLSRFPKMVAHASKECHTTTFLPFFANWIKVAKNSTPLKKGKKHFLTFSIFSNRSRCYK